MKRKSLKRIVLALSAFLCVEIGLLIYQINSGTAAYARNLDLGNKYLLSEDYDNAISAFSKAIEIDAMNADAYIGRGDAYRAKGDYVSAWSDYEKAEELSGNEEILREKIGATDITVVSEDGKGVDGATVKLNGSGHSYEFMTDTTGHISEVIFPEKYNMEVVKEDYESVETELSAEEGGSLVEQIQLRSEIDKKKYALIEEYKSFISSQNNGSKHLNYFVYDIDKDGNPEIMIERMHIDERRSLYDLYTYDGEEFSYIDVIESLYPHHAGEYASYPAGKGMVFSYGFRGIEIVGIIKLNNGKLEAEYVYEENVESDQNWRYYLDKYDQIYQDSINYKTYINHQYYQSETSKPYFEGSYLLGQSSMDNFTALYEAFGVKEDDVPTVKDERTSQGVVLSDVLLLNESENTEITSSVDGQTYGVRYSAYEIDDEVVELNLTVNNTSETFRLEDERVYFASIESVHVADINPTDAYGNFIVVLVGEDDVTETFIFAFSNSEINQISDYQGRLIPESINGEGIILLAYTLTMPIMDYGCFEIQPEITVTGLSSEEKTIHCGRYKNKKFDEGVWPTTDEDLTVYTDNSRTQIAGIIPAGSTVEWQYKRKDGVFVKSEDVEGYVTIEALRAASM